MQNLFKLSQPFFQKPVENTGGDDDEDDTDDGTGGDDTEDAGKKKPVTFTPEQQEAINLIVGKIRQDERKKLEKEAETQAAKVRDEAEKKALEEKGEFKKLAEAAEKKADEAEKRAEEAKAEANKFRLQRKFDETVSELGVKFVNAKAGEDAFAHLDIDAVGEDFKGMTTAVKQLIEDRDYLFEETGTAQNIDATPKGKVSNTVVKRTIVDSKRKNYSPL